MNPNLVTWRSGQPDFSNGKNVNNFRSHHLIARKFLDEFPEAVFLRVDIESQLDDEEVSSVRLE
jgi:hypothetical protein